jgi:hypothetical protein
MGLFGNSASGDRKAERPIVLDSGHGQVEFGAPDSRGRYTVTVTDRRGNVVSREAREGDRYEAAQRIEAEHAASGGRLRRRP